MDTGAKIEQKLFGHKKEVSYSSIVTCKLTMPHSGSYSYIKELEFHPVQTW